MAFMDERYLLESETALGIFTKVKDLPIVDPHNHADVAEIAANACYSDPWKVFAATDHYVWEVMRKRNVPEDLITGKASAHDKFMALAKVMPEIVGNPVYEWIHLDLRRRFGLHSLLCEKTAQETWDKISAALKKQDRTPRALLKEMNVEVMCSTDDPVDTLEYHEQVNQAEKRTLIRPTWRPDKSIRIFKPEWKEYVQKLGARYQTDTSNLKGLVEALKKSHDFFAEKGCRASDHDTAFVVPGTATEAQAEAVFRKVWNGEKFSFDEQFLFTDYLTQKFAEMDAEKGWVYQMHIGVRRDVRDVLFRTLGPDSGGDVSDHQIEIVAPLCRFLNRFEGKLKMVLYSLEPAHVTSLAAVSRAFGSNVRLGSAWWLNDTPVGMRRQLEYVGSVDLYYDFAGMVSDSRKILSYASRFEMFRRVLSNVLGNAVEMGQIPYPLAEQLAVRMCYTGPKRFFNL